MQKRAIQFWLQLLGYSFLCLLGAQIRALLLAWATRAGGVKPPRLYFLHKDHPAQSSVRLRDISLLRNLGYRTLQSRRGTPLLPFRSACKNLSLFEMEGTYISSLAFQDSSPSPPLLLSYPFTIPPGDFNPSLSPFLIDLSFNFRQEAVFHLLYTPAQSVPWSSCTQQENEHGWCAFLAVLLSQLLWESGNSAALLLTALTDDYDCRCLNYSV